LTDSPTLVWLCNQPPNDLPNAMMTRWLAYIRLFDFDTKHVPGSKNGAADALSRHGEGEGEGENLQEVGVDDFFKAQMSSMYVDMGKGNSGWNMETARVHLNEEDYADEDLILNKYLVTLQRPEGVMDEEYQQLRRKSKSFFIRDGYLYKRGKRVPCRVIGLRKQKEEAMKDLHDEVEHGGRNATFEQVKRRYQWKGMFEDMSEWVKTCEECQRGRN